MKQQPALMLAAFLLSITCISTLIAQDSLSSPQAQNSAGTTESLELGHPVRLINPVIPTTLVHEVAAVVLSGTMTKGGTFQNLAVAGGTAELGDPAMTAVKQWLYTPSTRAGKPVDLSVYISLNSNRGSVTSFVEPNLPFPTKASPPPADLKGKIYKTVQDMQPPQVRYAPDPEYSQAARAAKRQGTVVLGILVGTDGRLNDVWVERGVGFGLDQKAIDTVRQWKFQPAIKDGQPVAVYAMIEVAFHLF